MSDIIASGKAHYWGTSEWSAAEIRAAWDIAEKHHLRKPVMEQPQYHLFHRQRVEQEYAPLYESIGLGLTTWSPLASGLLTGKYRQGVPAGSRGALENMSFLAPGLTDPAKNAAVAKLEPIAAELGASVAQLAIAWAAKNPRVSTVITGASSLAQLQANLGAVGAAAQAHAGRAGADRRGDPFARLAESPPQEHHRCPSGSGRKPCCSSGSVAAC
jgi:aryl-alcohol dehydrogenase-like predicted oxidoreductase